MYAAAGGASLASRQARQKQRQKKNEQLKAKRETKVPIPKQYHNYTDDTPPILPKLSRVERGTLKPPTLTSPHSRRHSTSTSHLKEPHHHRGRIRESPSISIPVQQRPSTPCTLIQQTHNSNYVSQQQPQNSLPPFHQSPSLISQLPQVSIPEDGKLERRCSFVRQVEEMEKCQQGGLLDRCNHICNFEIKENWDNTNFYTTYERDVFGSMDYPFSECSQGRAAWQERERGRRCSLSEEARQHRIKQTEAHHRWIKRNRIHDTSYGGGSDEEDFLSVYHQSAAANALLYVGLGTIAIGSIIFFVGTGEKGFKTLELRLIGPTLVACGLLCCLIRVLLCACPSKCLCKRKKQKLKDSCSNYQRRDVTAALLKPSPLMTNPNNNNSKNKKVSIIPPNHSLPSTSTSEFKEFRQKTTNDSLNVVVDDDDNNIEQAAALLETNNDPKSLSSSNQIIKIHLPSSSSSDQNTNQFNQLNKSDSIIELQNFEFSYDVQSVSSNNDDDDDDDDDVNDSDNLTVIETTKLTKIREPANNKTNETCLSVVIEGSDNNSDDYGNNIKRPSSITTLTHQSSHSSDDKQTHSGIVLSPLQLGQ